MYEEDVHNNLIDKSVLQKQLWTIYLYQRSDGNYIGISPISLIDSYFWYIVSYDRGDLLPRNVSHEDAKRYLQIREFPPTEGKPIVNDDEIYLTKNAAVVPVRSKDKKNWENNKFHKVKVLNLPKRDVLNQERVNLLRNLIVQCSCPISTFIHVSSPLQYELLRDMRVPYIDSYVDLHGSVALLRLSDKMGFGDTGLGINPNTQRISRFVCERELEKGVRTSNYRMNIIIAKEVRGFLDKFEKGLFLKRMNQISPL